MPRLSSKQGEPGDDEASSPPATFPAQVWALVRQVPRGRVVTYGQVATMLGSPRLARQVGWAMAASGNAKPPVPWQRVINASGRISGRGEHERAALQELLLRRERVVFDASGRVDLARFGHRFDASEAIDFTAKRRSIARAAPVSPRTSAGAGPRGTAKGGPVKPPRRGAR